MTETKSFALFDSWTTKYDAWFETPPGRLIKKYESELLLELLDPLPGETILDVGCGTGIFTRDVMARGPRVTGVDLSEPMLRMAVDRSMEKNFNGICADMCALPFEDKIFDKVLSMTAIEFVLDAKKAVDELNRVTRKGGCIVLTTLNSLSPWADRRRQKAKNGHTLFQEIFFRSPDEMRSLVPADPVVKTAIHFQKEDSISDAPKIEENGNRNHPDKGAFLAVQWNKL
ncbi:class I SAM-dependent methyltransferase [Desulfospira joergensenii]|uniref:class I SAM-dependent methyltransferase n=1 Tax=Desulfospira joergensenii TaxID=53329 RepID=UPI0004299952|nr:class I SAM-dependent methyltransferase [Desulfospira joergensenii]